MENWKDIKGYEGNYQVSNIGRIKSMERLSSSGRRLSSKIMKVKKTIEGYNVINLYFNRKMNTVRVHRLVAKAFLPNLDNKTDVNHINGVKDDNRIENLEWATRSENIKHAFKTGLSCKKGVKNSQSKLKEEDIYLIFKLRKEGFLQREIAKRFKVTEVAISAILTRKNWRHVKI